MIFEREYGTATTISFPLIAFSLTSYHTSVTSTMFAAGDIKISKDFDTGTNTSTLPASAIHDRLAVLSLTATEMQAATINIVVVDQTASKVWEDQTIIIETYGNASARHAFDRSLATVPASLTADQSAVTVGTVNNLGASATAQVNAEADTALADASVTANAMNTIVTNLDRANSSVIVASMTSTVVLNNLGASATAQINAEADTALADASVTSNVMNTVITNLDVVLSTRSSHSATDAANAVFNATITSTSFNADTVGERVTAIDNKLPAGTISDFDETTDGVTLTASQVAASLTASQTGVTIAAVTTVTTVNNLGASATAQINSEVVDVMTVDTITEQGVAAPPAAPTFAEALDYLYMAWRNQTVTDGSLTSISNDAGTTIASAAISFATATTTFTKNEFA